MPSSSWRSWRRTGVGPRGEPKRLGLSTLVLTSAFSFFQQMLNDSVRSTVTGTGLGGQRGNDSDSSAAGSQPHTNSSDKPLLGPAERKPRTPLPAAS